jgi:hypothetical protein
MQYTDDKINKLVYQLYGLSEEEVGLWRENKMDKSINVVCIIIAHGLNHGL